MTMRWRSRDVSLLVLAATVLPLAACRNGSPEASSPSPHAAPTGFASCNQLGSHRADGFVVAGFDWSGERHAYDEAATLYACVYPPAGGVVTLVVSGHGIHVRPHRRRVSAFPTGVVPFRVTVDRGGSGHVDLRQDTAGGGYSGGAGPAVASRDVSWRFVPAGSH